MADTEKFNPFRILSENLMLTVLLNAFKKDAAGGFEHFMDYEAVSKKLREILSEEENWEHILQSMPASFNVRMIEELKNRKTNTQEGRYQVGTALLFLKFLYDHVKPYADDDYLCNQYDYYLDAFLHMQKTFSDFPGVLYVTSYVSFHISKRFFTMDRNQDEMRKRGAEIYKISVECSVHADKLEHPLANIFRNDTDLQFARSNINIKNHVNGSLPPVPQMTLEKLITVLSPSKKIDLSSYSEEDQDMLLITWQKLLIENCYNARELFKFAIDYEMIATLTEYFYSCFARNHFHRMVLAYNPVLTMSDKKDNILYLFKTYKVSALVDLHQAFRVFYPKPDSVLMSTLLKLTKEDLRSMSGHIDHILSLPHTGTRGWQINFLDAYRDAVDDGTLKEVSPIQMKMVLHYFHMVDHAGEIAIIVEREAYILGKILHCHDDIVHQIAMRLIKQLMRFTTFDALGNIDHQEILLTSLYNNPDMVRAVAIKDDKDYEQIALTMIQSYKKLIATPTGNEVKIIVPEFIKRNSSQLDEFKVSLSSQFKELGYLE